MTKASAKTFGEFFTERRRELGYTLRRFCEKHGLDAGNLSRIERGKAVPPQKRDKLEEYAEYLELKKDSDKWYEFFDLARTAAGRVPPPG